MHWVSRSAEATRSGHTATREPDAASTRRASPSTRPDSRHLWNVVSTCCGQHPRSSYLSGLKTVAADGSATELTGHYRWGLSVPTRFAQPPSGAPAQESTRRLSVLARSVPSPSVRSQPVEEHPSVRAAARWRSSAARRRAMRSSQAQNLPAPMVPPLSRNTARSRDPRSIRHGSPYVLQKRCLASAVPERWRDWDTPGWCCCRDRKHFAAPKAHRQRTNWSGSHTPGPTSIRPTQAPMPRRSPALGPPTRRPNGTWIYRDQTYSSSSPDSSDPPASGS